MRDEVNWFAAEMDKVLDMNEYKEDADLKGHWMHKNQDFLYESLVEEVDELRDHLNHSCECCGTEFIVPKPNIGQIIKECCDIANFAMMIADNAKKDRGW